MKKIVNLISTVVFVLVIIVLASYFVLRSNRLLEIYQVQTGSMEEGIHAGDYILINKRKSYQLGDIVTYKKDNYYITHRIIKQNGNKIITKGDANNIADDEIDSGIIVGKVLYSGGLLNFIINYKFLIIGILLTIYLITYLLDNDEEKVKNKKKQKEFK